MQGLGCCTPSPEEPQACPTPLHLKMGLSLRISREVQATAYTTAFAEATTCRCGPGHWGYRWNTTGLGTLGVEGKGVKHFFLLGGSPDSLCLPDGQPRSPCGPGGQMAWGAVESHTTGCYSLRCTYDAAKAQQPRPERVPAHSETHQGSVVAAPSRTLVCPSRCPTRLHHPVLS